MTGALFDPPRPTRTPGQVEAGVVAAVAAARADGKILEVDAGMVEVARAAAHALDEAEAAGGSKMAYAIQAAAPSLMDALHALGLPTKVAPVPVPTTRPTAAPADSGPDAADWLRDRFGSPE